MIQDSSGYLRVYSRARPPWFGGLAAKRVFDRVDSSPNLFLPEQRLGDRVTLALNADAAAAERGFADGVQAFDAVAVLADDGVVGCGIHDEAADGDVHGPRARRCVERGILDGAVLGEVLTREIGLVQLGRVLVVHLRI